MKKVKIISFIALTLCLVTVLISCGSASRDFLEYLDDGYEETPTVGNGVLSETLKDVGGMRSSSGNLITFFDYVEPQNSPSADAEVYDAVYSIYNLKTDSIVVTFTVDYEHNVVIKYDSISGVEYFIAETNNYSGVVTEATLYDSNGAVIASVKKASGYQKLLDDFKFGGKIFSTDKNGAIVELGEASEFFDYTSVTAASEDFMYVVGTSAIAVYDKFGNAMSSYPVKTHLVPNNYSSLYPIVSSSSQVPPRTVADVYYPATDILIPSQISSRSLGNMSYLFKCGVLRNGNVYIQYLVELPEDAEDYDVYFQNNANATIIVPATSSILPSTTASTDTTPKKYNVVTEIFDIHDGSVKELDVDFIMEKVLYEDDLKGEYATKDDFEYNLAWIRRIDNKGAAVSELVVLDNKLKIRATSNDIINGISVKSIECIGDGIFCVKDTLYRLHFIFDGKTPQTLSSANYNEKYIYTDKTAYDYEFTSIYDLAEKNHDVISAGDTSLLIGKQEGIYFTEAVLLTNTGAAVDILISKDDKITYSGYKNGLYSFSRTLSDGKTVFEYYNEAGTLVGTYDHMFDVTIRGTDGTVFAQIGETYYRFAVETAS